MYVLRTCLGLYVQFGPLVVAPLVALHIKTGPLP